MHCRLEAVSKLLPFVGSPEYLGNVNIGSFACILGIAITIFKESKSRYCLHFQGCKEKFTVSTRVSGSVDLEICSRAMSIFAVIRSVSWRNSFVLLISSAVHSGSISSNIVLSSLFNVIFSSVRVVFHARTFSVFDTVKGSKFVRNVCTASIVFFTKVRCPFLTCTFRLNGIFLSDSKTMLYFVNSLH